jgi:Tol biopolymer transport system component
LAYASIDQKLSDIWIFDLSRGVPARVTFDPGGPIGPVWSPDGRSVAYASIRNGHFDLCRKAIDGGAEELLYSDADDKYPTSWSSDGQFLLFTRLSYMKPESVWVLPLAGNRGPSQSFPVPQSAAGEKDGEFSPDGRWISYDSTESGSLEVYLVPFEGGAISLGGKRQITRSGGSALRWRKDGKEVFYRKGRTLMAAPVTSNEHGLQFGDEHQIIGSLSILGYDVSADGQRFLLALRARQISTEPLIVLQNWRAVLNK